MANHRELTAARAAGLSPSRLARPVAGAAGLLIVIAFRAQTYGIPYWERMALRSRAEVTQTDLDGSGTEFWYRSGGRLLRVGGVVMGRIPTALAISELDDKARLNGRVRAEGA